MPIRRLPVFPIILVLAVLLPACGAAATPSAPAGKLRVVATFTVIADFARNIGGDQVELTTLVGPGLDTHAYSPTPADGAALAKAQVILQDGLGFEHWLDDLYTASGSSAPLAVVTAGLQPIVVDGETDPHVWHDVANAELMVRNIRDAFVKADPAHAPLYQSNAEAYLAQLQILDEWVLAQVATLPAERRKLVTTHDTFGYFAKRYDFEVLGSILPTSTEGAAPSAKELAALVDAVRAAGVPAVFAENVSSNALLNQVAAEAGVKVVDTLFTDALGPAGSEGATFLDMVHYNVKTIVEELNA